MPINLKRFVDFTDLNVSHLYFILFTIVLWVIKKNDHHLNLNYAKKKN